MANSVYDDEQKLDDLEKSFHSPSATQSGSQKLADRREINRLEGTLGSSPASKPVDLTKHDSPNTLGKGYTAGDDSKSRGRKLLDGFKKIGSKKWTLAIGGVGGFSVVGIVMLLLFLASAFKIPNLAQNIVNYQFARMSRQYARSASTVNEESVVASTVSDSKWKTFIKDKFTSTNTGGQLVRIVAKFDKYRPSKVVDNLVNNHGFNIQARTTRVLGREVTQSMTIDGKTYVVKDLTGKDWIPLYKRIVIQRNQNAFAREVGPALSAAMRTDDVGPIIRGVTGNNLRKQMDINLIAWSLQAFKNKNPAQAELEATREKVSKVTEAGTVGGAQVPPKPQTEQIAAAQEAAASAEQATLANDEALTKAIANGGVPESSVAAVEEAITPSLSQKFASATDMAFAIAYPLCIIEDGSISNSGPLINANTRQASAHFHNTMSAAGQLKAGVQTNDPAEATALATAAGATGKGLERIDDSNPMIRAGGGTIDTSASVNPEAGADGGYNYSILDAIGASSTSITKKIVDKFDSSCSLLTDTATAVAIGVGSIIASMVSFGGSEAAAETVGQGARVFIQSYTKTMAKNIFGKKVVQKGAKTVTQGFVARARKFIVKQGLIIGGTIGATELAHMEAHNYALEMTNGLSQNEDEANLDDAGGNFTAGQYEQGQLFGRPLTAAEVAQSQQADTRYIQARTQSQSAYERYLAVDNASSLISRMAISVSANLNTSVFKSMINLGSMMLRPLTSLASLTKTFSSTVHAEATPTDLANYGNVQFGWSEDEEKLIGSNTSYYMLENQKILDDSQKENTIAKTYANCFGYDYKDDGNGSLDPSDPDGNMQLDVTGDGSIGTLLASGEIARDSSTSAIIPEKGLCSPKNLGANNPTFGDLVLRWRLASQYDLTLTQQTGLANAKSKS